MKQFTQLQKLSAGDQVGIISPSADLAGRFPWVLDLGLKRLKEEFGLEAIEYPTTRSLNNSLEDRARDIMAAFADPANKAVIATIGGDDQIKLLKYLDKQVFLDNPKPYFGFSDNTHLANYLWNLGIPSYYGGCILTQYAMPEQMDDFTVKYLKHALFDHGEYELQRSDIYNDVTGDWADKNSLDVSRLLEPNDQWHWDGEGDVEGILWGGCLESMVVQSSSSVFLPSNEDLNGAILFIESADGNTDSWIANYVLSGFGERGWLSNFTAVLVGRPKAWELDLHRTADEKAKYREEQRKMIVKTIRMYNPTIPIIQNLDFGHTDPQAIIPNGQKARVVSSQQKIFLTY
jgi:muramoyltetrapeptide carboxypeptidase LdcA involved in peptidoglycan recycling